MTRAHSISSRGLAPSMNAKLALTADLGDPAVRQACRCNELMQGGFDEGARSCAEGILQAVPPFRESARPVDREWPHYSLRA